MPKLKVLSGKDLLKMFAIYGFEKIDQHGSHIKIRRVIKDEKETLTIPMHNEIDKGLLKQILIQASRYIPEDKLRENFYTK
jgi:predicted RNA binding protein YcfA (HicA-like mRNA interferase family)